METKLEAELLLGPYLDQPGLWRRGELEIHYAELDHHRRRGSLFVEHPCDDRTDSAVVLTSETEG